MILPIYTYGQNVLREETEDVTPEYPELPQLIQNMFETMYKSEGVGLAAPQVGLPIRLIVVTLNVLKDEYPEYEGFNKAYINPYIEEESSETVMIEEGCLSIPGIHEKVKRPSRVRISYQDEKFEMHDEWVDGYLARVLQHEIDHLDGFLFTDRLSPLRKRLVRKSLTNIIKGKVSCNYKIKTAH